MFRNYSNLNIVEISVSNNNLVHNFQIIINRAIKKRTYQVSTL